MGFEERFGYLIYFKKVRSLEEAENIEGYFDYHRFGKMLYSVAIDKDSLNKNLAKIVAEGIVPEVEKFFLDHPEYDFVRVSPPNSFYICDN